MSVVVFKITLLCLLGLKNLAGTGQDLFWYFLYQNKGLEFAPIQFSMNILLTCLCQQLS